MNVPVAIGQGRQDGEWPLHRSAILDWLMNGTRQERFLDNIFMKFVGKLRDAGLPIGRASLHLTILHPQWYGARVIWQPGGAEPELQTFEHGVRDTSVFLNSPMKAILEGSAEVRRHIERADERADFAICEDLAAQGFTDYVVWPLDFTLDKRHAITFAADRPGGFTDDELACMKDFIPALAAVSEIRLKNRMARTLLETYVGPHASGQILSGSITRGSGVTVNAVVLICDLRGFTQISELWPRDDVIAMLNDYFDAISEPVQRNGGEILKFMGDGMLGIFPTAQDDACASALKAATEARAAMRALNDRRADAGEERLGYGIGVHIGDVMYGNIGSRARLDFTVIGPAVNIASRLEGLTKTVGHKLLFSGAFVAAAGTAEGLVNIGSHPLRGVGEPVEVYALT